MSRSYTGRVTTLEFSDGIQRPCADCEGAWKVDEASITAYVRRQRLKISA